MARTRAEIKTLVHSHTGRTKDSLESSLCDSALKLAGHAHPFKDSQTDAADQTITEDETSVDISSLNAIHVISARIVEADGMRNQALIMKSVNWWDKHVVNAEDNTKGWPLYGLHRSNTIYLDRPCEGGLELRLRITTIQIFTNDSTECPISILDLFVEDFVTAGVFKDLTLTEQFMFWHRSALGNQFEINGNIGGLLNIAIESDKKDIADEHNMEPSSRLNRQGLSILNNIDGHDNEGNYASWYHSCR